MVPGFLPVILISSKLSGKLNMLDHFGVAYHCIRGGMQDSRNVSVPTSSDRDLTREAGMKTPNYFGISGGAWSTRETASKPCRG